jgi:hypothetical protein
MSYVKIKTALVEGSAKKLRWKNAIRLLDVLVESFNFIALQYLLLCFLFSFKTSIVYVLLFAVNVSVIGKYWSCLKAATTNKVLYIAAFCVSILLVSVIIYVWGYFPVVTVLKELA